MSNFAAETKCILCNGNSSRTPDETKQNKFKISCLRCGNYFTTLDTNSYKDSLEDTHILSGITRERSDRNRELITINLTDYKQLFHLNIPKTVSEKSKQLLFRLALRSRFPGDSIEINESDYPIGYCRDMAELNYFLEDLNARNLLLYRNKKTNRGGWTLTTEGWRLVEERTITSQSKKVFVALCYNEGMQGVYERAIAPAISESGFQPIKVNDVEHIQKIDDLIVSSIKESRFVVADFTHQRGGVYFEAGYALGLGLPVIWTCKKTDAENLHFDTRQYNHIIWENEEELKLRLRNRVGVIV